MKKALSLVVAFLIAASLAACGNVQQNAVPASSTVPTSSSTSEPTDSEGGASSAAAITTPEAASFSSADQKVDASGDSSITLPILAEIEQTVTVGTSSSFMTAVQMAVKLLDWGTNTGLDPEEIRSAAVSWLADKGNDEQVVFSQKLALVDEAYQKLLGDGAEDLLASAGCEDTAYPWSDQPVESIEAIMTATGLR